MRERIGKGRGKFGIILGLLVALLIGGTNFLEEPKKSGAAVTPDHMVSMLVNWPPPESCGSPRVREKTVLSWFDRLRREF